MCHWHILFCCPDQGDGLPHRAKVSPHSGDDLPHHAKVCPHSGDVLPHHAKVSPDSGDDLPHHAKVCPHSGDVLPHRAKVSPDSGDDLPHRAKVQTDFRARFPPLGYGLPEISGTFLPPLQRSEPKLYKSFHIFGALPNNSYLCTVNIITISWI